MARSQLSLNSLPRTRRCSKNGIKNKPRKNKKNIISQNEKQSENKTTGNYKFGAITYLRDLCHNIDKSQEIKKQILIANKCFYGLKNQLIKSHVLSETSDEKSLAIFENFRGPHMA
jgi:hypothetical protein